MQIISQNYVVWNTPELSALANGLKKLQIISQNYVVWNASLIALIKSPKRLQIISQNYVVWNVPSPPELEPPEPVANYITKLRGLKLKYNDIKNTLEACCKLYHKTTWFETSQQDLLYNLIYNKLQIISQNYVVWNSVDNAIARIENIRLQIISQNYVVWNIISWELDIKLLVKLQIISQNYVVWNFTPNLLSSLRFLVANYITKLRGLKLDSVKLI